MEELKKGPSAKNISEVTGQLNGFRSEINKMWEQVDGRLRSLNVKFNRFTDPTEKEKVPEFTLEAEEERPIPNNGEKPPDMSIYDYQANLNQGGV